MHAAIILLVSLCNFAKSPITVSQQQPSSHTGENFEKIHQHIGAYKADCEAAWIQDPQWTLTTEGGKVPTTFAEWLDSLLRPSRWIC